MKPGSDTVTVGGEKIKGQWNNTSGVRSRRWYKDLGDTPGSPSSHKKYKANERVNLKDDKWEDDHKIEKQDKGKKFDVILALTDGLYKTISTKDSTKIPGWITYQITVYDEIDIEDDGEGEIMTAVGSIQATVQGLLKEDDHYRWAHRFHYSTAGIGDNLNRFRLQIIDHGCTEEDIGKGNDRKSCNLLVMAYGNDIV